MGRVHDPFGVLGVLSLEQSPPRSPELPGPWLASVLEGRHVGELVHFPRPVAIASQVFTHAVVERDFRTKSRAQLLRLLPGDALFICKHDDVRMEAAAMAALKEMNRHWRRRGVVVCGLPVQVVTYTIVPLGALAGLVEVVAESRTLHELGQSCLHEERHLRVLRTLQGEVTRLDRLAASTVAYLTSGYALGIRDGHDDNIMLHKDGALFRVDFGFLFGETPTIDAPQTIIPNAVAVALSDSRWK